MYLAYKYVALAVLLAEANFNAERLDLPMERPIQESQLTLKHIQDPKFLRDTGFGGRVDSGGYTFTEGGRTAYHHFIKLAPFGRGTVTEQNEVLSHQQSLITSNGAYELAVGRLKAIDVEVRGLEKTNTVEVRQRWFWGKSPATRILLPIFDVRWGSWDR